MYTYSAHLKQTCYLMGEFYGQQVISHIALRENQSYATVTVAAGYFPCDSPAHNKGNKKFQRDGGGVSNPGNSGGEWGWTVDF